MAEWLLPVQFEDGFQLEIPVACVPGNDPLLLGNEFLDKCKIDNLNSQIVYVDQSGEHICRTYKQDGHRFLEVAPREQGQQQF